MSAPQPDDAFLNIDPDNLDVNCFGQPKLVRYWTRQLALAAKKASEAKNNVKLVWSELRQRIRESPAAFSLEKVTVDTVDDAAIQAPEYQTALKAQVDADYQEAIIKANVEALKSRDYQLTNSGELLKLGYFAAPRVDPSTRARYMQQKQGGISQGVVDAAQDSKPQAKKPAAKK